MHENSFDLGTPGLRSSTAGTKITSPSLASITDPASPKEKTEPRYSFQRRREYIREWDSWRSQWEASGGTYSQPSSKTFPVDSSEFASILLSVNRSVSRFGRIQLTC